MGKLKSMLFAGGLAIVSGAWAPSVYASEKKQPAPAPKAAAAPMMARPAQPGLVGAAPHQAGAAGAHVPGTGVGAHVPGNAAAPHVPGNISAAHVPGNVRAANVPAHESAGTASHKEPHAESRMEAERPKEAGRAGHELRDHAIVGAGAGAGAAAAVAVSREREIAHVQEHRDIPGEHEFVHAHEHDFHTRDVRDFNDRERAAWRHGRWHDDWHYGRHGWWWGVDGVWYEYPAPVYPYPMVVAPLVVHEQVVIATPLTEAGAPPVLPAAPPGWYRCAGPAGYYPDVAACPAGWTRTQEAPPLSSNDITAQ